MTIQGSIVAGNPVSVQSGKASAHTVSYPLLNGKPPGRPTCVGRKTQLPLGLIQASEITSVEPWRYSCASAVETLVDPLCTDALHPRSAKYVLDSRSPRFRKLCHCWDKTGDHGGARRISCDSALGRIHHIVLGPYLRSVQLANDSPFPRSPICLNQYDRKADFCIEAVRLDSQARTAGQAQRNRDSL